MKLTEKEIKLMDFLINKVLVEKKGLDKEEVEALQDILKKLNKADEKAEEAEKKKIGLSEVVEHSMEKALVKLALKESNALEFKALPLKSKAEKLKAKIEELQKSPQIQKALSEQAQKKEEEEFEKFYGAYVQKHGRSL